jgi:hypothetical protein
MVLSRPDEKTRSISTVDILVVTTKDYLEEDAATVPIFVIGIESSAAL